MSDRLSVSIPVAGRCENCCWWVQLPRGFRRELVTPLVGSFLNREDHSEEANRDVTDHGQCRRMPPVVNARQTEIGRRKWAITVAEFPDTPRDAWCGEFRPARSDETAPAAEERTND